MSVAVPKTAMVLAAGLGLRLRPLTERLPKPLVQVGGRALIDHSLDRLAEAGVETAVVNVHHLADQMEAHLAGRAKPAIAISDERAALLDSGGGVVKALPRLGTAPFFVLNADSFWLDRGRPNLVRLAEAFDPAQTDLLMLLAERVRAVGFDGRGDFLRDADGRLERRGERAEAPYVYAGCFLVSPDLFADAPAGAFSLNRIFDAALVRGRLHGLVLDGLWLHVGAPAAVAAADAALGLQQAAAS